MLDIICVSVTGPLVGIVLTRLYICCRPGIGWLFITSWVFGSGVSYFGFCLRRTGSILYPSCILLLV